MGRDPNQRILQGQIDMLSTQLSKAETTLREIQSSRKNKNKNKNKNKTKTNEQIKNTKYLFFIDSYAIRYTHIY